MLNTVTSSVGATSERCAMHLDSSMIYMRSLVTSVYRVEESISVCTIRNDEIQFPYNMNINVRKSQSQDLTVDVKYNFM